MKATLHKTALGALLALTAIGCTEERPYEAEGTKARKIFAESSDFCTSDAEYFYVPSTVEASRSTTATRPHWMGKAKHVKLKCTETSIQVVEVDVTNDFSDNPTNLKPVLTIPVEFGTLQCAENSDGKCSNKEEFATDMPWKLAKNVRFDVDKMSVQEVNLLPIQLDELFGSDCHSEKGEDKLLKAEVTQDSINITLEKTFNSKLKSACIGELEKLSDLGFSVRYHYSIVKLDTIADKNYKALEYPKFEEYKFGYFDTKSNKYDVDNNKVEEGDVVYVNRWNPNKVIQYHMNSDFLKPENQSLIPATKVAVKKINEGLKAVGANMQIDLLDPDTTGELMTGDIRVNSIVLEDDPLAMNVIGYGPSAANLRTGEILHGRTVMYLGTIRKFVKRTYDEFVEKKVEELDILLKKKKAEQNGVPGEKATITQDVTAQAEMHLASQHVHNEYVSEKAKASVEAGRALAGKHSHVHAKLPMNEELLKKHATDVTANVYSRLNDMQSKEEKAAFLMDKNCMFTSDMVTPEAGMDEKIDQLIMKFGLKNWIELDDDQQKEALALLTPFVWVPVLVHELGHNLGLRHNFAGSEDKANFYTKDELIKMGLKREFAYSSVMDYSYSTINELPVLGKYDLAALRYGYAETVELNDGKMKDIHDFRLHNKKNPNNKLVLKDYDFCTDEQVSLNPNCNRFDEGSNLVEITQHHIRAHKEGYKRNNFRNGKLSFSLFDDAKYLSRLNRSIGGMRLVFERYENIKNSFGLADNSPAWEQYEFLKDIKDSVKISAEYLTSIITTPDLMCAVATKAKPTEIIALLPIRHNAMSNPLSVPVSCYDDANITLPEQFKVVGHAGKYFQTMKDPNSDNNYIDQVDVRGIWLDKLVALDILTGRKQGVITFDKYHDNFMDIADVAASIDTVLRAVTTNQVVAPVTISTIFGNQLTVAFPVSMYDSSLKSNSHRIMDPINKGINIALNMPDKNPTFQEVVLNNLKLTLPSDEQNFNTSSLLNSVDVIKLSINDGAPNAEEYVTTKLGNTKFTAAKSSSIAASAILTEGLAGILDSIGKALAEKVIADINAGNGPAKDATDQEKLAHQVGKDILQAYVNGVIQPRAFYTKLITSMAKAPYKMMYINGSLVEVPLGQN